MRRSRTDYLLLVFISVTAAIFVMFSGNKTGLYAILFYPFFMLIVAEMFVNLLRACKGWGRGRVFAGVLLLSFLFKSAWHYEASISANWAYDYYAITDRIEMAIPPDARVMGLPTWWLGLAEHDYRSSLSLTYYHFYNGYSLTQSLEIIHPDIIIIDGWQRQLLVDTNYFPPGPGFEIYNLPRQEFESFLAQRGEKVLEFTDPWHGTIEVYAIHWD